MNKSLSLLCLLFAVSTFLRCTDTEEMDASVVGTWRLTTWTINESIDINNDNIASINLLDEAECANNETLVFTSNGIVSSNSTYNPNVQVHVLDENTQNYSFDIECDEEGTIGLTGSYIQDGSSILILDKMAAVNGDTLTIVYEKAIEIYNEDFTLVVETKDLTLVYSKD